MPISLMLHKTESLAESNGTDDIKRIPLDPRPEVNGLTGQVSHSFREHGSTFVNQRLHLAKRRELVCRSEDVFLLLMVHWVYSGEDVIQGPSVEGRCEAIIEMRLCTCQVMDDVLEVQLSQPCPSCLCLHRRR